VRAARALDAARKRDRVGRHRQWKLGEQARCGQRRGHAAAETMMDGESPACTAPTTT
jgi:hypothetical protein